MWQLPLLTESTTKVFSLCHDPITLSTDILWTDLEINDLNFSIFVASDVLTLYNLGCAIWFI
jgi:hypothetical protein